MSNESERDRLVELLKEHCDQLGEHFQAVQIFASVTEHPGGREVIYRKGTGPWSSRVQMAQEAVIRNEEAIRYDERRLQDEEEEG